MHVADASHRVVIEEKVAVGELRNLSSPESVRYYDEWEWSVEVWNVGGLAGDFRVKLTGDIISEIVFTVEPGSPMLLTGYGIGPANFQVHLELVSWVLGDSYHHVVGPTLSEPKARAERHVAASSEVTVEVGESVEGVDFPDAEFRNPNFPSEVGPDEVWESTIEGWNSGTRRGWFLARLVWDGNEAWGTLEIPSTQYGLCSFTSQGPKELTWYLYFAAEFTEHDSLAVSVPQRTSPPGELRDLKFPKFGVKLTEPWEGSIEAWNHGTTMETFRLNVTGDIEGTSESFELGSGEHTVVTFGSVGPTTQSGFTATLQRMLGEEWVDEDSKAEVVGEELKVYTSSIAMTNLPPPDSPYIPGEPPDRYFEAVPGAEIFLDGEFKLTSSSVRWFPLFVAKDVEYPQATRKYSIDVISCGYLHYSRHPPYEWEWLTQAPFRGHSWYMRNWFPVA